VLKKRRKLEGRGGGMPMPSYEFFCPKCNKEISLTLTISERERGEYKCPSCGSKDLAPLLGRFFSKTSRKS
jgi:putative FmdB family regulatory protein